jgi:hypothetical protein
VSYAIEFLCLSAAKLMVLERMSLFAGQQSRRWFIGARVVLAAVIAANVAGVAGNIAAAVNYDRAASIEIAASDVWAVNNSVVGRQIELEANVVTQHAHFVASVQEFCEVAVLLIIVLSFVFVGASCARRVAFALSSLAAGAALAQGQHLRRQIVTTTSVVFAAFLLRATYSIWSAVASKLQARLHRDITAHRRANAMSQDTSLSCPDNAAGACNATCFNVFTHMVGWMNRTPQFQLIIVLLSSPFALMVALWGMTSNNLRSEMRRRKKEDPTMLSMSRSTVSAS